MATGTAVRSPLHDQIFGYDGLLPTWSYESLLRHIVDEDRDGVDQGFRSAIEAGTNWSAEFRIKRADGAVRWVETIGRLVADKDSRSKRVLGIIADVTERKEKQEHTEAALKEKELLLREIHHRVKNNLQVVQSLLDLQSNRVDDVRVRDPLRNSFNRISSMALVHQTLYQSEDLGRVDFRQFLGSLIPAVFESYKAINNRVSLSVDVDDVHLPLDAAVPCGLVINELISNSLKHAFPRGRSGKITVSLSNAAVNEAALYVRDDGIGLPEDVDPAQSTTLGLQLVSLLSEQLGGEMSVERASPTGFSLRFPVDKSQKVAVPAA